MYREAGNAAAMAAASRNNASRANGTAPRHTSAFPDALSFM
jgi:hypothetical protein